MKLEEKAQVNCFPPKKIKDREQHFVCEAQGEGKTIYKNPDVSCITTKLVDKKDGQNKFAVVLSLNLV